MADAKRGPTVAEMTRITSVAEIDEILRNTDIAADLHNRDSFPLLGGTILTLTKTEHLERRRTEARVISRDALRFFEDTVFVPLIRQRLERLAREQRGDEGLVHEDLLIFTRMVLVQLTASMIGLDGLESPEEVETLYQCAERFGEAASVEWSIGDHDAILATAFEASDLFYERWMGHSLERRRQLISRRAAALAAGEAADDLPLDLLTMLLVHAPELDNDALRREAIFFLLASSSTTTHAAPHVILELLEWLDKNPADRDLIHDIVFIKQVVNEGLRLHPPVPALLRRSLRPVTLSSGRTIEAGEHIALDMEAVNQDAETFGEDPLVFNPRREISLGPNPYGFSFGGGPHMCLGRPLATSTQKVTSDDAPLGSVVLLVRELMNAGLELDPAADPPRLRDDTVAHRFATFDIIFRNI
jgi:cytochrome P450